MFSESRFAAICRRPSNTLNDSCFPRSLASTIIALNAKPAIVTCASMVVCCMLLFRVSGPGRRKSGRREIVLPKNLIKRFGGFLVSMARLISWWEECGEADWKPSLENFTHSSTYKDHLKRSLSLYDDTLETFRFGNKLKQSLNIDSVCFESFSATKASINGIVNHINAIVLSAKVYFYERFPRDREAQRAEEVGSENQKRI